jgi:hypothetical protein
MGAVDMTRAALVLGFACALAVGCAGCGNSDGAGPMNDPKDLTLFIGTWNVVTAQLTTTCTDHGGRAMTVSKATTLIMGVTSGLVDNDPTCPVLYDVSGRVARAQPNQTCDNPDLPSRMYFMDDTFTVDGTGMATHKASGKLGGFINISLGETVQCTFTEMGTYSGPTPGP